MSSLAAAVSPAGNCRSQLLTRSPLKWRHPRPLQHPVTTTSITTAVAAAAAQEPEEDSGITREELQTSYLENLTQAANPVVGHGRGQVEGKKLGSLGSIVAFLPNLVTRGASLFRVYLQHIAMVVTTVVVVLLACSLRG